MKEVPTISQLLSIVTCHELKVQPSFFKLLSNIFRVHFLMIDPHVPDAKGGARRRTDDPCGL